MAQASDDSSREEGLALLRYDLDRLRNNLATYPVTEVFSRSFLPEATRMVLFPDHEGVGWSLSGLGRFLAGLLAEHDTTSTEERQLELFSQPGVPNLPFVHQWVVVTANPFPKPGIRGVFRFDGANDGRKSVLLEAQVTEKRPGPYTEFRYMGVWWREPVSEENPPD